MFQIKYLPPVVRETPEIDNEWKTWYDMSPVGNRMMFFSNDTEAEEAHHTWNIKTQAQDRETKGGSREILISFPTSCLIYQALHSGRQEWGRETKNAKVSAALELGGGGVATFCFSPSRPGLLH